MPTVPALCQAEYHGCNKPVAPPSPHQPLWHVFSVLLGIRMRACARAYVCLYLCMQETCCMPTCCLCSIRQKSRSSSALAASAYLYWQARARPPHADKFPLCIIDDNSLKVSGKDGGSSGLGAICRRPFSRDVSCPGLTTHPCNHQLSLLST